jgi:hypothetical protein
MEQHGDVPPAGGGVAVPAVEEGDVFLAELG